MKGWKTITYVAASILAVLSVPQIQELIAQHPELAIIVNGVVVAGLRWVTTTTIFNK